jgi:hypothetical protein
MQKKLGLDHVVKRIAKFEAFLFLDLDYAMRF